MTQDLSIYIKKILKQVHPHKRISEKCVFQINSLLNHLGDKISQVAVTLTQAEKKKTIS